MVIKITLRVWQMSALDLLMKAEGSRDLQHYARSCAVDVLGAAGMVSMRAVGSDMLYRIKYLGDFTGTQDAQSMFIRKTYSAMKRRKLNADEAGRVGHQALKAWIGSVCGTCHGRKYEVIEGTPKLSARPCGTCHGSGSAPLLVKGENAVAIRDVMAWADALLHNMEKRLSLKLA